MRKSWISFLLVGLMIISLCGCGIREKKTEDDRKERATEASTLAPEATTAAMDDQSDLTLPENFDNMDKVMIALAMQNYVNGYSYYGTDTEKDDPDAFFAPMAVLTSLMESDGTGSGAQERDGYYYITEDTFNMAATALFADYGTNIEAPAIPDDNEFVTRDDETETFGVVKGETRTEINILSSEPEGDAYRIDAELIFRGEVQGNYEFLLVPTTFEGENNLFAYSVKEMVPLSRNDGDDSYDFDQNTENDDPDADGSGQDIDSGDDDETASDYESSGDVISEEEARKKIEEDYGQGNYTYEGTEKIGNKDYYMFVKDDSEDPSRKVLISTDGQDSVSGTKNEDGSWSLDQ